LGLAVSAGHVFSALYVRDNWLMPFRIPTASMYPGIWPGDQFFATRNVYLDKDPAVGDIVAFPNPDNRSVYFIKRVIALAGDRIEIRDGVVYIDDRKLEREEASAPPVRPGRIGAGGGYFFETNQGARYRVFLDASVKSRLRNMPPMTVPQHQCFVLGDNRDNSLDSRSFGPIPIAGIVGRADFIYAPAGNWARFGTIR
jgi:signal peptidase I